MIPELLKLFDAGTTKNIESKLYCQGWEEELEKRINTQINTQNILIINCLLGSENIYLFLAVNKKTAFSVSFLKNLSLLSKVSCFFPYM